MPDWDENSPQLRNNLREILRKIRDDARRRKLPTIESARAWHVATMQNLTVDDPRFVGGFRGEQGLENIEVRVGRNSGVASEEVSAALHNFEKELQVRVAQLDRMIRPNDELDVAKLAAVVELCAWVHAEWVRIHPFANGNGRTARLWANSLAMRYGLPPFVRLRPRPDGGYGKAGEQAMNGDWEPTVLVFHQLLRQHFEE